MAKGEKPIYYDKLIFGYEEKSLWRVLPPIKFFSNKASNIYTQQRQINYIAS